MTTLEKAARAIANIRGIGPTTDLIPDDFIWRCYDKENAFAEARAAIEALKEATPDMRIAGGIAIAESAKTAETQVDNADACWQAMINIILNEQSDA